MQLDLEFPSALHAYDGAATPSGAPSLLARLATLSMLLMTSLTRSTSETEDGSWDVEQELLSEDSECFLLPDLRAPPR